MVVPSEATDSLLEGLQDMDGVVAISVQRGEAIKPPGDVVGVSALNTAADAVLCAAAEAGRHGPVVVGTSAVDSLIATKDKILVRGDHDEATWEESETAMRRHTRPNTNLVLSAAGGGVVAVSALAAVSGATDATALVAAAIIAP